MGVGAVAIAATTAKTAGGSVAPKAIVVSSALVKWLTVAAVGATLTAGTLGYVHHARQVAESSPLPAAPPSPPPAPVGAAPKEAVVPPSATLPLELGVEGPKAPPTTPPMNATRPKTATAAKSTLDDQVAMVDQARQAEAAGDAATALELLNAYDAKYPNGSLAHDSTVLRIEALVQQGNRAAAEHLAARFMATQHPSTLDVRNIRRALDPSHP